jgi:hypothetical protein
MLGAPLLRGFLVDLIKYSHQKSDVCHLSYSKLKRKPYFSRSQINQLTKKTMKDDHWPLGDFYTSGFT